MAKKKTSRDIYGLVCTVCGTQIYVTERNKVNTPTALSLKRYCKKCKKRQLTKEKKSLD